MDISIGKQDVSSKVRPGKDWRQTAVYMTCMRR
ncbi:hypothetical protein Q427_18225 [Halomonas sp. BC04]|nr:hypothetical protein Q427_18225 [Halomonas sp. BC04]